MNLILIITVTIVSAITDTKFTDTLVSVIFEKKR